MVRSLQSWQTYREAMLAETARFIEWGLAHPDEVEWIPAKITEQGGYPQAVSQWFWGVVLSARTDARILRWKQWLLGRPPFVLTPPGRRGPRA